MSDEKTVDSELRPVTRADVARTLIDLRWPWVGKIIDERDEAQARIAELERVAGGMAEAGRGLTAYLYVFGVDLPARERETVAMHCNKLNDALAAYGSLNKKGEGDE